MRRILMGSQLRKGRCGYSWFINQALGYKKWLYAGSDKDGEDCCWRMIHWLNGDQQQVIVQESSLRAEAMALRPHIALEIRVARISRRMNAIRKLQPVYGMTVSGPINAAPLERCSIHDPLWQDWGREWNMLKSRLHTLRRRQIELNKGKAA